MMIPWLEELEQEKSISKEAKLAIYEDCRDLIADGLNKEGSIGGLTPEQFKEIAMTNPESLLAYQQNELEAKDADVAKYRALAQSLRAQSDAVKAQSDDAANRMQHERIIAKTRSNMAKEQAKAKLIGLGQNIMGQTGITLSAPFLSLAGARRGQARIQKAFTDEEIPKAQARFREIVDIAPSIATDTGLIMNMTRSSLSTGLTEADRNFLRSYQVNKGPAISEVSRSFINASADRKTQSSLRQALKKSAQLRADHIATAVELVAEACTPEHEKAASNTKSVPQALGRSAKLLAIASAAPLVASGLTGLANTLSAMKSNEKLKSQLEDSLNHMMKGTDDASMFIRENKDQAREAFDALTHFAPDIATQKGVAKAFVYRAVAAGGSEVGMTTEDVKNLSAIQKNITQGQRPGAFTTGFSAAGKMVGLPSLAGGISRDLVSDIGDII